MLLLFKIGRFSFLWLALCIAILLTMPAPAAQAHSPAMPPTADWAGAVSPAGLLNPDGTLDLSSGFQGTLDLRGWQVTLDGERGPLLAPVSGPAASQVTAWNALDNEGLGGGSAAVAIAVVGNDLYVGGNFTTTGDGSVTDLNYIARYNIATGTWSALPNQGLDGPVLALAVVGSDLYMGGGFSATGDGTVTNLGNIVRYSTTLNTWNDLPKQGLSYAIYALAVVGSDLYVGGQFTTTGDGTVPNLNYIARYDTTNETWNALNNQGLSGIVTALVVDGSGHLYVGGVFTSTGDGTLTNLGGIAYYNTAGTWSGLSNQGLNGGVNALAVVGSDLYVGGSFTATGDGTVTNLGRIARYSTTATTWHALSNQGIDDTVDALAVVGSDLYVGGSFTATGDGNVTNLGRIARYSTTDTTWHALPNAGLGDSVYALAVDDNNLYAGGFFTETGDGNVTNLGYIARGALPATSPEIEVKMRGGVDIPDNRGDVFLGSTIVGRKWGQMFYVKNTGQSDLTLEAISVPDGFYTTGFLLDTTLAPGKTNLFGVALKAEAEGEYSGAVQFATNDPNENPFNFTVKGTVVRPEIQVTYQGSDVWHNFADLGSTPVGTPYQATFTVRNWGQQDLTLTGPIQVPNGFTVTSSFGSTTLPPGETTTFVVQLDAVAEDDYMGDVEFGTNAPFQNPFKFEIIGTVTTSAAPEIAVSKPGQVNVSDNTGFYSFGSTPVGTSVNSFFTVSNNGQGDLTLGTINLPTGFSTAGFNSTTLTSGESTYLLVKLDANAGGVYSGKLQFTTNDPDENPFDFTIAGTVTGVAAPNQVYLPLLYKSGPDQWNQLTSPTTKNLNGIDCPSSDNCVAVGDAGTILTTDDGGETWTTRTSGTAKKLYNVSCESITTCVAVGEDGTMLATSNGGETWTARDSDTGETLRGINCPGYSVCLAAGGNSGNTIIVASFDGGTSWQAMDFGDAALNDASCPDASTCTVGGQYGRTFGAARWPRPSIPDNRYHTLNTDLIGLDCPTNTSNCYTVGVTGKIYATTNGGAAWTEQTSGTVQTLWEVSCTSATSCFAVGSSGTILTTDNSGGTWTSETSPVANNLMGVDCSTGRCYVVGGGGIILKK